MSNIVASFFRWFDANKDTYSIAKFPMTEAAMDIMTEKVHEIDADIWFEIGGDPKIGITKFIFTAHGNVEKFEVIKAIFLQAPAINGWKFIALKPPQSPKFITDWKNVKVDPGKTSFTLMVGSGEKHTYALRVIWPGFQSNEKDIKNALYIAIDTILGEEKSAKFIKKIWCVESVNEEERHGYLSELMSILDSKLREK